MFKLSEWKRLSTYDVDLNTGSSATHIELFTSPKFGLRLMDQGAKEILQKLSEKQGKKMNTVESALKIASFLKFFKDQINMAEVKYPLQHFKTFNEFFIRELKPGARTMAYMNRDDVAVCAADCRLMVFQSVEDSTRFWIKGRKFSIRGLLGKNVNRNAFLDGSLVIFRLAPQVMDSPFIGNGLCGPVMAFAARPLSLMVSSASLTESWTVCEQACTIQTSHGQVMARSCNGQVTCLFGLGRLYHGLSLAG
uniref:Uncharacterized protein n=1 Tax=Brassica oleracea var. oleracea TaxID=109376 RepID=A0A0D3D3V4_BRAOL